MNTVIKSILSVLTVALIATTNGKNLRRANRVDNADSNSVMMDQFRSYVQNMNTQKEHSVNSHGRDHNSNSQFEDVDGGTNSTDTDGCRGAGDWIRKSKCEDCCIGHCEGEAPGLWGGAFGVC